MPISGTVMLFATRAQSRSPLILCPYLFFLNRAGLRDDGDRPECGCTAPVSVGPYQLLADCERIHLFSVCGDLLKFQRFLVDIDYRQGVHIRHKSFRERLP